VVGTANGSGNCATITATIQFQRIRPKKLYLLLSIAERSRAATQQKPADQTTKSPNSSDCYVRSPEPAPATIANTINNNDSDLRLQY